MDLLSQPRYPEFDLTEMINGEEIMGPSPFLYHQQIVSNLYLYLRLYVDAQDLGKVYISPLDVIFEEKVNVLQPDVIFIKKENLAIGRDWIRGVPDLVAEVVSKGTVVRDTVTKKEIYLKYQVPEYWIIMPEMESVEVFVLEKAGYELFSAAEIEGLVRSRVVDGFEIDIKKLLQP
ncbi:MAG: Uma2 family endonuclease [Deltaproteobacteria bacterium]|nr:Uma2 family endonuclease [Deltaproteobacteria bacterium]